MSILRAQSFSQTKQRRANRLNEKLRRPFQKFLFRVNRKTLISSFERVGVKRGCTVCVHASLGRIGYVVGGPDVVIDALMEIVGPQGCIMMPSFPMRESIKKYLDLGQPFDVRNSPSRDGILSEVFRKKPGVLRSLHPTNPVAAWGGGAEKLLQDHEKSRTPYGLDTPYGRLAELDNAFVLMLETHVHSLLHHLQERVRLPNLFLEEQREAPYIDWEGRKRKVRTKVMRPRVPYFLAIPSASGPEPDWAILHDFALMFPKRREREVRQLGYRFDGYHKLYRRRAELEQSGVLQTTRVGRGEIGFLHVKSFIAKVEPKLRDLIDRFRPFYDPDHITALRLPYS